jgi:hypothetical protein
MAIIFQAISPHDGDSIFRQRPGGSLGERFGRARRTVEDMRIAVKPRAMYGRDVDRLAHAE